MKITLEQLKNARPGAIGLEVKINLQGRFRRGKILNIARTKDTQELLVKVRVNQDEMIYSAPFRQTDWHKANLLRKADQVSIVNLM